MITAQATTSPATYSVEWGTETGFAGIAGRTGWAVVRDGRVAMIFGGTSQSREAAQKWADKLNEQFGL